MELFKLLGTIAINSDGAISAIDETTEVAEKSHSKISSAFEKIGGAAVKVGAVVAKGTAVAAGAIGTLSGLAIKGYADYEQLVGGVETLFGAGGMGLAEYAESVGKTMQEAQEEFQKLHEGQNIVLKNADQAYKTAGMSANEYMETVTGFSAALISSLDGNTVEAAKKADQAIVDMADNANKMGSSLESIQNAYSGFAKQNYTMLDNLKLGYGGTQEEMKRLLADAQAISGVEYDISSYADVVDAIHVVQEEMGIAGTTAKEASETISGSAASMKAAWHNLVTGIANEDADAEQLIDNLLVSVDAFGNNILPRIEVVMNGIGQFIQQALPEVLDKAIPIVMDMLPKLLTTAISMLKTIFVSFAQNLPSLVNGIFQMLSPLLESGGGMIRTALSKIFGDGFLSKARRTG